MSVVREENGTWTVRAYYRDFDGERKRKTKRLCMRVALT